VVQFWKDTQGGRCGSLLFEEKVKVKLEVPVNKKNIRTALKNELRPHETATGAFIQRKMQDS